MVIIIIRGSSFPRFFFRAGWIITTRLALNHVDIMTPDPPPSLVGKAPLSTTY